MKCAGLSVDVDSVASHLAGYGFSYQRGRDLVYSTAIPRALEVFSDLDARATFFLIAREAQDHPETVRAILDAGHEVGSHSLSHTLPFPREAGPALEREVGDSKRILEDLGGRRVVGFRAPSWEYSPALIEALAASGYRYDASVFASPLLLALRWSVARRATEGRAPLRLTWRECLHPASVGEVATPAGGIAVVPVCTTPGLRVPYYHTLGFLLPGFAQKLVGRLARRRRSGVSYCFHAVDFLGLEEDGVDTRLSRHPGMDHALTEKLGFAEVAVKHLGRGRTVVPLAELVEHEVHGTSPGVANGIVPIA